MAWIVFTLTAVASILLLGYRIHLLGKCRLTTTDLEPLNEAAKRLQKTVEEIEEIKRG